jgi:hypothetical protein
MKFAPGTDPKKAQEALMAAGYPAPQTSGAGTAAVASPVKDTGATSTASTPSTPSNPPKQGGGGRRGGGRRGGRREGRRQAGMNFGLLPTEVIEQTRGRGYGLSYMPQQRTAKQIKFGGGGPQNVINFNPIMSQQQNPNIRVGGAEQTASPQFTASPVYESGPGDAYGGGGGGGGFQMPDINIEFPEFPIPKTEEEKDPKKPKGKSRYRRLMDRYMKKFDRTAYGAGSKRGVDRFSALDIRKMRDAGRKFGGSRKRVARDVIAYANRYRGKTKMGGSSRKELDKLQAILGKRRSDEKKRKSKAAKAQRQKKSKRSKKKSRSRSKALARAFKSSRKRGGGKRSSKRSGGKRGKRR